MTDSAQFDEACPADVVQGAEELLSDQKRWIKGEFALREDGRSVSTAHEDAYAFCLIGAVQRVARQKNVPAWCEEAAQVAIEAAIRAEYGIPVSESLENAKSEYHEAIPAVTTYNDKMDVTHKDVLRVLKRARAIAKRSRRRLVNNVRSRSDDH